MRELIIKASIHTLFVYTSMHSIFHATYLSVIGNDKYTSRTFIYNHGNFYYAQHEQLYKFKYEI